MLPAPGQGALAVECLDRPDGLAELLACVDDPRTRAAVTAERSVLAALAAGCSAPVGAYAAGTEMLHLTAVVARADGGPALRASADGAASEAARLGGDVAAELLRQGAGRYVAMSSEPMSNGDDA